MKVYKLSELKEVEFDEKEFMKLKKDTNHFSKKLELIDKASLKLPIEVLKNLCWYGTKLYKVENDWFVFDRSSESFCTSPHVLLDDGLLIIGSIEEQPIFSLIESFEKRIRNIEDGITRMREGFSRI